MNIPAAGAAFTVASSTKSFVGLVVEPTMVPLARSAARPGAGNSRARLTIGSDQHDASSIGAASTPSREPRCGWGAASAPESDGEVTTPSSSSIQPASMSGIDAPPSFDAVAESFRPVHAMNERTMMARARPPFCLGAPHENGW